MPKIVYRRCGVCKKIFSEMGSARFLPGGYWEELTCEVDHPELGFCSLDCLEAHMTKHGDI